MENSHVSCICIMNKDEDIFPSLLGSSPSRHKEQDVTYESLNVFLSS